MPQRRTGPRRTATAAAAAAAAAAAGVGWHGGVHGGTHGFAVNETPRARRAAGTPALGAAGRLARPSPFSPPAPPAAPGAVPGRGRGRAGRADGTGSLKTQRIDDLHAEAATELGYAARLRELLQRNDPRTILMGRSEVEAATKVLSLADASPAGAAPPDLARIAHAHHVLAATSHPATGSLIPRPLRVAAFPWMNLPLVAGCLAATGTVQLLVLQIANQAYNACFNMANGAHGAEAVGRRAMLRNFAVATVVACAMVFVAQNTERLLPFHGPLTKWIVPYMSVVSADLVNICFARSEELTHGVPIADPQGRHLGFSRAAGRATVARAILTRSFLLPAVALLVPTFLMMMFRAVLPHGLMQVGYVATALELVCIELTLLFGLPACASLFPETMRIAFAKLELAAQEQARRALHPAAPPALVHVYRGL